MLVPFIYHGKLKAFLGLIRAGIIANYKLAINIFLRDKIREKKAAGYRSIASCV